MKQEVSSKITGTIILLTCVALVVGILIWTCLDYKFFSSSGFEGASIYERHNFLSMLIKDWLMLVLVIFPVFLACIVLILGYGKGFITRHMGQNSSKHNS